eukprot:g76735.t1
MEGTLSFRDRALPNIDQFLSMMMTDMPQNHPLAEVLYHVCVAARTILLYWDEKRLPQSEVASVKQHMSQNIKLLSKMRTSDPSSLTARLACSRSNGKTWVHRRLTIAQDTVVLADDASEAVLFKLEDVQAVYQVSNGHCELVVLLEGNNRILLRTAGAVWCRLWKERLVCAAQAYHSRAALAKLSIAQRLSFLRGYIWENLPHNGVAPAFAPPEEPAERGRAVSTTASLDVERSRSESNALGLGLPTPSTKQSRISSMRRGQPARAGLGRQKMAEKSAAPIAPPLFAIAKRSSQYIEPVSTVSNLNTSRMDEEARIHLSSSSSLTTNPAHNSQLFVCPNTRPHFFNSTHTDPLNCVQVFSCRVLYTTGAALSSLTTKNKATWKDIEIEIDPTEPARLRLLGNHRNDLGGTIGEISRHELLGCYRPHDATASANFQKVLPPFVMPRADDEEEAPEAVMGNLAAQGGGSTSKLLSVSISAPRASSNSINTKEDVQLGNKLYLFFLTPSGRCRLGLEFFTKKWCGRFLLAMNRFMSPSALHHPADNVHNDGFSLVHHPSLLLLRAAPQISLKLLPTGPAVPDTSMKLLTETAMALCPDNEILEAMEGTGGGGAVSRMARFLEAMTPFTDKTTGGAGFIQHPKCLCEEGRCPLACLAALHRADALEVWAKRLETSPSRFRVVLIRAIVLLHYSLTSGHMVLCRQSHADSLTPPLAVEDYLAHLHLKPIRPRELDWLFKLLTGRDLERQLEEKKKQEEMEQAAAAAAAAAAVPGAVEEEIEDSDSEEELEDQEELEVEDEQDEEANAMETVALDPDLVYPALLPAVIKAIRWTTPLAFVLGITNLLLLTRRPKVAIVLGLRFPDWPSWWLPLAMGQTKSIEEEAANEAEQNRSSTTASNTTASANATDGSGLPVVSETSVAPPPPDKEKEKEANGAITEEKGQEGQQAEIKQEGVEGAIQSQQGVVEGQVVLLKNQAQAGVQSKQGIGVLTMAYVLLQLTSGAHTPFLFQANDQNKGRKDSQAKPSMGVDFRRGLGLGGADETASREVPADLELLVPRVINLIQRYYGKTLAVMSKCEQLIYVLLHLLERQMTKPPVRLPIFPCLAAVLTAVEELCFYTSLQRPWTCGGCKVEMQDQNLACRRCGSKHPGQDSLMVEEEKGTVIATLRLETLAEDVKLLDIVLRVLNVFAAKQQADPEAAPEVSPKLVAEEIKDWTATLQCTKAVLDAEESRQSKETARAAGGESSEATEGVGADLAMLTALGVALAKQNTTTPTRLPQWRWKKKVSVLMSGMEPVALYNRTGQGGYTLASRFRFLSTLTQQNAATAAARLVPLSEAIGKGGKKAGASRFADDEEEEEQRADKFVPLSEAANTAQPGLQGKPGTPIWTKIHLGATSKPKGLPGAPVNRFADSDEDNEEDLAAGQATIPEADTIHDTFVSLSEGVQAIPKSHSYFADDEDQDNDSNDPGPPKLSVADSSLEHSTMSRSPSDSAEPMVTVPDSPATPRHITITMVPTSASKSTATASSSTPSVEAAPVDSPSSAAPPAQTKPDTSPLASSSPTNGAAKQQEESPTKGKKRTFGLFKRFQRRKT